MQGRRTLSFALNRKCGSDGNLRADWVAAHDE